MKKITLLMAMTMMFCFQALGQERGEIAVITPLDTLDFAEINLVYQQIGLTPAFSPIDYEIDVYKVIYYTLNAKGDDITIASGAVFLPRAAACKAPLLSYSHGTTIYDGNLPSDRGGEYIIGVPYATGGYVVAMADYLGLGESPGFHPYIHAKSEATCSVDMARAARSLADSMGVELSGQVFVTGYSQGGHTAMATFREMETLHNTEFQVDAAGPASGPYDVSGVSMDTLLSPAQSQVRSYYMAYVILAYQSVYGDLYNDLSEVFVAPYDSLIPLIINRNGPQTATPLPPVATDMLQPAMLSQVMTDSMHPFNVALRDNDLYNWTPQAPLRMYYCNRDEQVPYQNSLICRDSMLANGASVVAAIQVGPDWDHSQCAGPALTLAKFFFDSELDTCVATTAIEQEFPVEINIYPNPFYTKLQIDWTGYARPVQQVRLYDIQGRVVFEKSIHREKRLQIDRANLPPGAYIIEIAATHLYRKVLIAH